MVPSGFQKIVQATELPSLAMQTVAVVMAVSQTGSEACRPVLEGPPQIPKLCLLALSISWHS